LLYERKGEKTGEEIKRVGKGAIGEGGCSIYIQRARYCSTGRKRRRGRARPGGALKEWKSSNFARWKVRFERKEREYRFLPRRLGNAEISHSKGRKSRPGEKKSQLGPFDEGSGGPKDFSQGRERGSISRPGGLFRA